MRNTALVICDTILLVSLHLEQEVRTDGEDRLKTAADAGVVARPEFVARADDRRLLIGAASSARIFFVLSGPSRASLPNAHLQTRTNKRTHEGVVKHVLEASDPEMLAPRP